jgi:hypothetical protein
MMCLREPWLLELLAALPFHSPNVLAILNCGANVVRKTHGFRDGICGIWYEERAASVVERAASGSRLFSRRPRVWKPSTSLNWGVLVLVLLLEGPAKLTWQLGVSG